MSRPSSGHACVYGPGIRIGPALGSRVYKFSKYFGVFVAIQKNLNRKSLNLKP